MPVTIEQWIRRKSAAAVVAGLGDWANAPPTALGKSIYKVVDGPVSLVLSELGIAFHTPTAFFESRYDQIESTTLAPLREIIPQDGDLLPRRELSRLVTLSMIRFGDTQPFDLQFTLSVYNQIASVLPRIVNELAQQQG